MSGWNFEEYLNKQIKEIEELKRKGYSHKEIQDKNLFCHEALRACGFGISYLVPKAEGQDMTFEEWDTHTSNEHKWEYYNGSPFGNIDERDRVMLGLIYTSGLKHLLDILPKESKEELIKLVKENMG